VSLPGREPSHSADGVAPLTQQSASSTLKARPAKLYHAAAHVDREDNHAPGGLLNKIIYLTSQQRLDNPINYATHKTPRIKAWLARRPHYHVHFTPTSASWINQVERWFAELTRKQIQRGVHTSVRQLEADIRTFIDLHNKNPKPFKWTKSADQILASVKRFCHKAQQTLCGEL